MKILFTTDWHLTDKKPSLRKESDFFDVEFRKVARVFQIAKEEGVEFIIHGGDFFEKPNVEHWVLNHLISLFKSYRVRVFCVVGSHDIFGYNLGTVAQTALGILMNSGFVEYLGSKEIGGRFFRGVDCSVNLPRIDSLSGDVVVMHQPVSTKREVFECLLVDDIAKHYKKKIFLCGHVHRPFLVRRHDCLFVNSGPLLRLSIDEANLTPQVAILDFEGRKVYFREVTSNKDVFVHNRELSETHTLELDSFVQSLKSGVGRLSLESLLERVNSFNIDNNVKQKCKELLRVSYESRRTS